MKSFYLSFLILILLFNGYPNTGFAVTGKEAEIDHILQFISESSCSFERNGKTYPAPEAQAHIKKKYDYMKSKINSAEDFIEYAATKSSMSGKYYKVSCMGKEITSQQWLLNELAKFRKSVNNP